MQHHALLPACRFWWWDRMSSGAWQLGQDGTSSSSSYLHSFACLFLLSCALVCIPYPVLLRTHARCPAHTVLPCHAGTCALVAARTPACAYARLCCTVWSCVIVCRWNSGATSPVCYIALCTPACWHACHAWRGREWCVCCIHALPSTSVSCGSCVAFASSLPSHFPVLLCLFSTISCLLPTLLFCRLQPPLYYTFPLPPTSPSLPTFIPYQPPIHYLYTPLVWPAGVDDQGRTEDGDKATVEPVDGVTGDRR